VRHDVFIHWVAPDSAEITLLTQISTQLAQLLTAFGSQQESIQTMSAELDALEARVHANTDVTSSASALITGLAARVQTLADELAQAGVDNTKVQALADELAASDASLSSAVAANTPAAPSP
jgi:prophage DNA circulation protein